MKKLVSIIILLVTIAITIVFFIKNEYLIDVLKGITLEYFIILLILAFLFVFLQGLQVKYITKMYGKDLRFNEWFGLVIVPFMTNYIVPFKGGTSLKAVYLKKVHGVPYTLSVTMMGALTILSLFVCSLLGVALSLIYSLGLVMVIIFCVSSFILGLIIFLFPVLPETRSRKINYLIKSVNEIRSLRKNPKTVTILLFLKLITFILFALRLYYAFQAVPYDLPLSSSIAIGLFSALSLIINITPANLGVKEAVITFSASILGVPNTIGLSAAIIERVTFTIFVFAIGPIFSYILSRQKGLMSKKQS